MNRRKGVCRTREGLLDELADLIITVTVAMSSIIKGGAAEARSHFEQRLQTINDRTTGP